MPKLFLKIGVLSFVLALLAGCSSDEHSIEPQLSVDKQTISVSCDQSSVIVKVSSNVVWSVAASDSWIHVKPAVSDTPNGTISVVITPNGGEARNGSINFYAGQSTQVVATIEVNQAARGSHSTRVSQRIVALDSETLSASIAVDDVPHGWTFDIVEGASWMEVTKTPSGLSIVADPLTTLWRSGVITVSTDYDLFTIHVVQADFQSAPVALLQTAYFGKPAESPYSIGLLVAQTDIYDAPFVSQQYQDTYYIQFNIAPAVDAFSDFRLIEGRYPFTSVDPGYSFCSAGVIDQNNEIYGSCMLRKMWYQGQEYGMYGSIFQDGFIFVSDNEDDTSTLYIVGNGIDLAGAQENYAWKMTAVNTYVDMTESANAAYTLRRSAVNMSQSQFIIK